MSAFERTLKQHLVSYRIVMLEMYLESSDDSVLMFLDGFMWKLRCSQQAHTLQRQVPAHEYSGCSSGSRFSRASTANWLSNQQWDIQIRDREIERQTDRQEEHTYRRLVSRCCRNWPSWLAALTSSAESQSMWMTRLIASNSTAFLAFECCTFLDLGGSVALFNIVSMHSVSRVRTAVSSEQTYIHTTLTLTLSQTRI